MEAQRYETMITISTRRLFAMRPFTTVFTLIGLFLCLVHYLFHDSDPIYLLFYALSVPAWIASLFPHIYNPSVAMIAGIYILTIATWALIGYAIDRYSKTNRRRSSS
jgi:hypothetical protein